jgi:K+-sensing histidine kinase KdpD
LGLPLCQLLVELHGGNMAIASALGQGPTVTVTLPAPLTAWRSGTAADRVARHRTMK